MSRSPTMAFTITSASANSNSGRTNIRNPLPFLLVEPIPDGSGSDQLDHQQPSALSFIASSSKIWDENDAMEFFPQTETLLIEPRRGISPLQLIKQIKNTVPFIFEKDFLTTTSFATAYLSNIRNANPSDALTHEGYFELCLSAHHATVGSFVPTDVDHQIRFKLWYPTLEIDKISKIAFLVIKSYAWDSTPVSTRWINSPIHGERLSGHSGEWLSTAAAAYGALRKRSPQNAADIAGLILRELQQEAKIMGDFKKARDGIGLLKAATLIAHNLGDLDRVIDLWKIPDDDPLKEAVYKAGHRENHTWKFFLTLAGKLNKTFMAIENHRHFALRRPRCLRRNQDFLLPIGPFFDDWGARIAKHPGLSAEEVGEIAEALVEGWEKLQGPIGYARALSGILENFPGGLSALSQLLPARTARVLKAGPLRTLCSVPQKRFEEQWAQMALKSL